MSWTLALSVGSGGIGAAKLGAAGSPESVGFFPDVDRAFAFSSEGETTRVPEAALLVVPSTLSNHNLKWYLGEVIIAGVPGDLVKVRTIPEVLSARYGHPVFFADASWNEITAPDGRNTEFKPTKLEELLAEQGTDATVVLAGHPAERDAFQQAIGDLDPVLIEYPDLAAQALAEPTEGTAVTSVKPEHVSGSAEPNSAVSRNKLRVAVLLVVAAVIILALSFFL